MKVLYVKGNYKISFMIYCGLKKYSKCTTRKIRNSTLRMTKTLISRYVKEKIRKSE